MKPLWTRLFSLMLLLLTLLPLAACQATAPDIRIGENGNWQIDGVDIGTPVGGRPSSNVTVGENGNWLIDGVDTGIPTKGKDGKDGAPGSLPPTVGENGNWLIDGVDTGISAVPRTKENFRPVLRFAVASDVHFTDEHCIRDDKLEGLFAAAYAYSEAHHCYNRLDGAFFAGDVVDGGTPLSLTRFFAALDTHAREGTVTRACMGNHEFYHNSSTAVADFIAASGYSDEDSHLVLSGYHFILLSPDKGGSGFSSEKQFWLADQLSAAAAEDPTGQRPIFVFQHHHVEDTVYGSANTWGVTDLRAVLNRYPQVVNFSGHSHFPINDPRSIWQGEFTALNTASLKGLEMDLIGVAEEKILPADDEGGWSLSSTGRADGGQYYIVEVDAENRLLIRAFDIVSGMEVIEPILLQSVGDPSAFTYTPKRAKTEELPAFAADAAVTEQMVSPLLVKLRFPRTATGAYVQSYRCEIYTGDTLVDTVYRLDCGFLFPAPEYLTLPLTGLLPNTAYTVQIIPVTAFANEGAPLIHHFTTPSAELAENGLVFSAVFDEGNKATDSVTNLTLTTAGTPTTVYHADLGRYVGEFDGHSAFEFHEFASYYEHLQESVSFECYLRLNVCPTSGYVNPMSNQQSGGYGLEYKASGNIFFFVNLGGTYFSADAPMHAGEWVHLVGTFDGEAVRLYVNGMLAAESEAVGTVTEPSARFLSIGGDSEMGGSGKFANCTIAIANVYSKALTAEQVRAQYEALN